MAFSSEGRLVAMLASHNVVRLIDTKGFSELTRFEFPYGNVVESLTFNRRGSHLIAAPREEAGARCMSGIWGVFEGGSRLQLDWDLQC